MTPTDVCQCRHPRHMHGRTLGCVAALTKSSECPCTTFVAPDPTAAQALAELNAARARVLEILGPHHTDPDLFEEGVQWELDHPGGTISDEEQKAMDAYGVEHHDRPSGMDAELSGQDQVRVVLHQLLVQGIAVDAASVRFNRTGTAVRWTQYAIPNVKLRQLALTILKARGHKVAHIPTADGRRWLRVFPAVAHSR